jgi:hypothetical protein
LTDDDIDKITYQVRDSLEEVDYKTLEKQEELHQKVKEQLTTLQQLWEAIRRAPERISIKGPTISTTGEARDINSYL